MLSTPDGRWLLHRQPPENTEQVVILATVRAPAAMGRRPEQRRRGSRAPRPAAADPHESAELREVPVTVAMVIDATPMHSEQEAQGRLASMQVDPAIELAFGAISRLCEARRIAAADHHACNLDPLAAIGLWAGYGDGDQLAAGRWMAATRLPWPPPPAKRRRRSALLVDAGTEERMVALLSGREQALICEELALRARSDLQARRRAHCAIELERAYAAALAELEQERASEILSRRAELAQLHADLSAAAAAALTGAGSGGADGDIDEELLRNALQRLEAVLRARRLLRR